MDKLAEFENMGLGLSPNEHRLVIPVEQPICITIGKGDEDCERPDLAVVQMPRINVGTITAMKSFYNLAFWRTKVLDAPPIQQTEGEGKIFGQVLGICVVTQTYFQNKYCTM